MALVKSKIQKFSGGACPPPGYFGCVPYHYRYPGYAAEHIQGERTSIYAKDKLENVLTGSIQELSQPKPDTIKLFL